MNQSFSCGQHAGGRAERSFVNHQAGFEFYIVLQPGDDAPDETVEKRIFCNRLPTAAQKSLPRVMARVKVLTLITKSIRASVRGEFCLWLSLSLRPSTGQMSLPEGTEDVLKIEQMEKHFLYDPD
jgi:hypothetical protein